MDSRVRDELERAVEKEVFMQLQEEKVRLRSGLQKIQQMKKESGHSSGGPRCQWEMKPKSHT